jgi:hypothetical protein
MQCSKGWWIVCKPGQGFPLHDNILASMLCSTPGVDLLVLYASSTVTEM